MPVNLKTVNRYMVQAARAGASDAATSPEAANARAGMAEILADHPDIDARAKAIQRILDAPPSPFGMPFRVPGEKAPRAPDAPPTRWVELGARLVEGATMHLAESLVSEVSGGARREKLPRGDVIIAAHECAPGDVCIEVRCTAADVLSVARDHDGDTTLDAILDRIEGELLGIAEGGRVR